MYVADLHIHSRFSMATSKQLTLPHLAGWAMCKGIHVLGTGDFTHPAWQAELRTGLELDESSGLYRLKGVPDRIVTDREIADARPPLFCLQTEISSIYKRGGKVRRIHTLVFFPTLDDVERFSRKLGQIGNIESDGRPILGLDAHDLLELVLETSDRGICIPAHIWTPWFSLFGSRSGFDAIEDCFGDLTPHIFALETGLSSDPAMNRLVSALDGFALISNSDAHSGANLGREANLFLGQPSYDGMFAALRTAARRARNRQDADYFAGTLEIYPEEGKYHLDGHRACQVVMTPEESAAHGNICPVCGKPLTIGVLHRVWELADRKKNVTLPDEPEVHPIIPLPSVLAQIYGLSAHSKKLQARFQHALEHLGSEFAILAHLSIDEISAYNPVLGEAIRRIRCGEIALQGGYDGEFGTITVFSPEELKDLCPSSQDRADLAGRSRKQACRTEPRRTQKLLPPEGFARSEQSTAGGQKAQRTAPGMPQEEAAQGGEQQDGPTGEDSGLGTAPRSREPQQAGTGIKLTQEQEEACTHVSSPLLVLAGPGAGKTRLLTERIVRLLDQGTQPERLLALTFSRKAGEEILARVRERLPETELPFCGTFHALAWKSLRKKHSTAVLLPDEQAQGLLMQSVRTVLPDLDDRKVRDYANHIELMRERCEPMARDSSERAVLRAYAQAKCNSTILRFDFTDLLEVFLRDHELQESIRPEHVLVDEVQDLSLLQVRVVQSLLPSSGQGFFGIGDPDQSIYGFRGALSDIVPVLKELWPDLATRSLKMSFRSSQKILDLASQTMHDAPSSGHLTAARPLSAVLTSFEAPTQAIEERWLADQIAGLLGATSHTLLDLQKDRYPGLPGDCSPSDIAVLVRLKAQIPSLMRALTQKGIPVQAPSLNLFWQDEGIQKVLAFMEQQILAGRQTFGLGSLLNISRSTQPPAELVPLLMQQGALTEEILATPAWEQLGKAFAGAGSWERLLEEVCWQKEVDLLQSRAEAVRLLTMHAAKGLEFRAVFLPGFNDGLLPHGRALLRGREEELSQNALEEERRLLYVALTRASEALFLSFAHKRTLYGRELELPVSRFFADISSLFARKRMVRHAQKTLVQGSLV